MTKDEIRTRMAMPNHESISAPAQRAKLPPPNPYEWTTFSLMGVESESAAVTNEVIAQFNKKNGLDVKPTLTAIPFLTKEQLKQMMQQLQ